MVEIRVGMVCSVVDLFEAGAQVVRVYDDGEDEAPFVGTSEWDFPHCILQEDVLVVDYDEETGVVDVVRLSGFSEEAQELTRELAKWAEQARPGDFKIFSDFKIEFLPPDWESYYRYGCDTDGGNYCSYLVPLGWVNPQTGRLEFYLASYSSCELGDDVYVVPDEEGHLLVVEAKYLSDEEQENVVYHPWHPDFEVGNPKDLPGLVWAWEASKKEAEEEREAYEEWVSRRFG